MASLSIDSLFSPDERTLPNAVSSKELLARPRMDLPRAGVRDGIPAAALSGR